VSILWENRKAVIINLIDFLSSVKNSATLRLAQ